MDDNQNPQENSNPQEGSNNQGSSQIVNIDIAEEMKAAYIDYSMSVIVSRAIPDVRDGMKPVHRRVLYGMQELGLTSGKTHKKSARIVGEVLGKYHPHGDSSVYDTMVRMAQDWSLRYPLVNGQGNFGSVDGDSPAAMRYTEAKMEKIADEVLKDIEKETVDFQLNFDDSLEEPTVLPSRIPNLLVNGANGIAVGMATNMLPHNLSEVCNGVCAYIDDPEIDVAGLMQHVTAPDFPTGGTIYGYDGVKEAFETGRGRVVVRGRAEIVTNGAREQIIISEIPYQVNKSSLVKKIADLVNDKKINGISDIRDESDRKGMRVVIDVKRDGIPKIILNKLYQYTPLQSSFGVNNVCLVNGRPRTLNLQQLIHYFVEFRHDVVVKRTEYELKKAEERAHILKGLIIAVDNIDEVIALIRSSKTVDLAKKGLMERFELSDIQSKAILEMRLSKLTGLEIEKLRAEYDELMKTIAKLKEILENRGIRMEMVKDETLEIKTKFGDERRTDIDYSSGNIDITDLIPDESVVITISHLGYMKRTPSVEFRSQNRGGRGSRGSTTRDEDFIEYMFTATTHNYLLLFTEKGRCYWIKVYDIPEGSKTGKGRAIQNLLQMPSDDKVMAFIPVLNLKEEEYLDNNYLLFVTALGTIKKTSLRAYSNVRSAGVNAITIREEDKLERVVMTDGNSEVIIGSTKGQAIRFEEGKVRSMGRTATGVRGISLQGTEDHVVGIISATEENRATGTMLVLSENGYGKRTFIDDPETGDPIYRRTNRGGKGVRTMSVTEKTGKLVALRYVTDMDDVMIITKNGITIRMAVEDISTLGRNTQGVRLIKIGTKDSIAALAIVKDGKAEREEMERLDALEAAEEDVEGAEGGESNDGSPADNASSEDSTEISDDSSASDDTSQDNSEGEETL